MLQETTGLLYRFQLDGFPIYCDAVSIDLRDGSFFDGKLLGVFKDFISDEHAARSAPFDEKELLFKPVPVFNFPSSRTKNWISVGRVDVRPDYSPRFKYTNGDMRQDDWSRFPDWWLVDGLHGTPLKVNGFMDVQGLETTVLYSLNDIVIRCTMTYMLSRGMEIASRYDLDDPRIRSIWVMMLNA